MAAGLHPDRGKIRALLAMKVPNSRDELRRFSGMVQYLAKFLPNLSDITGPLRELLKNDSEWCWSPAQDTAVKKLLANTPVLAFYASGATTIVSADTSSYGMGLSCCKRNMMGAVHQLRMPRVLSVMLRNGTHKLKKSP